MLQRIKNAIRPLVPQSILDKRIRAYHDRLIREWRDKGSPLPPPHAVKQRTIESYQKKYGHNILVETGTYLGDMVAAQKTNFKKIISIELDEKLFEKATDRFKKDHLITIVQGDSGKVLPDVMNMVNEPAIFWLDGHYSAGFTAKGDKECPIYEEIDAIFKQSGHNHILLIDDARCFIGEGDYPKVEDLNKFVVEKNPKYKCEIIDDIIRFTVDT